MSRLNGADLSHLVDHDRRVRQPSAGSGGAVAADALTQLWPPPRDDRFNIQLGIRNLRCFWQNAAAAGARCLVLGMTVEAEAERRAVVEAIPAAQPTFVRLTAPPEELERRIRSRELGSGADWHVLRSRELVSVMEANAFEAAVIPTEGRPVGDVAREVLDAAGWDDDGARGTHG